MNLKTITDQRLKKFRELVNDFLVHQLAWEKQQEKEPNPVLSTHSSVLQEIAEKKYSLLESFLQESMEIAAREALEDFPEFCHKHYLGSSFDVGKWHYSYDNEVVNLLESFISQEKDV